MRRAEISLVTSRDRYGASLAALRDQGLAHRQARDPAGSLVLPPCEEAWSLEAGPGQPPYSSRTALVDEVLATRALLSASSDDSDDDRAAGGRLPADETSEEEDEQRDVVHMAARHLRRRVEHFQPLAAESPVDSSGGLSVLPDDPSMKVSGSGSGGGSGSEPRGAASANSLLREFDEEAAEAPPRAKQRRIG